MCAYTQQTTQYKHVAIHNILYHINM